MAMYWACAQTHPKKEQLALTNLKRQNFEAFFPLIAARDHRGRPIEKSAFPGYVFIRLNDDERRWSPINFTMGVQRLLTYVTSDDSGYKEPCRADFVDTLHRLIIPQGDGPARPDLILAGERIVIKRGPFAAHTALVTMSNHERVRVLLGLFSREVTLDIAVEDVQRISRTAA
jgi:transcription antitermination factor NusG